MPLATKRQDSCRSSFKIRGGCFSAALGSTLLWNSSFVYMDGGCREREREKPTSPKPATTTSEEEERTHEAEIAHGAG